MTIKVVRGLVGQANAGSSSTTNISRETGQSTPNVVRTGQAFRSDAVVSEVRKNTSSTDSSKVKDPKDAKAIAKSVAEKLGKDPEFAATVHNLRQDSGQTAL